MASLMPQWASAFLTRGSSQTKEGCTKEHHSAVILLCILWSASLFIAEEKKFMKQMAY